MNKMSKEKRDKLILTWLCIIGVLGTLYTFVWGAQTDKLTEYGNGSKKADDLLYRAQRLIDNSPIIERNLATNRLVLQQMHSAMAAPGSEYETFIRIMKAVELKLDSAIVARLATRTEVVREGLLPNFPYPEVSISFVPSAHFHELGQFIAELENSYPFMRVGSVRMNPEATPRGPRSKNSAASDINEKLGGDVRLTNFIKPNAI